MTRTAFVCLAAAAAIVLCLPGSPTRPSAFPPEARTRTPAAPPMAAGVHSPTPKSDVQLTTAAARASEGVVRAAVPPRTVWDDLADCESGLWDIDGRPIEGTARWDIVSPPHYGGLQFTLRSWEWVGGVGLPSDAPRDVQIALAEELLARQGWGAWPVCSIKLGLRSGS